MKLVSWNVNGLRSCLSKGFAESVAALDADVICLQETKMEPHQASVPLEGYEILYNSAEKKGYSGTAVFTRAKFLSASMGIGVDEHDHEGRVITVEFPDFYLVNCYTPNSQRELARLDYRMRWEDDFQAYIERLDQAKPVALCGDLNVAHTEIDLKNPKTNRMNAGFTDQERARFTELLARGLTDTFRHFNPGLTGAYTWWSYMHHARQSNAGWRIDYFVVSNRLLPRVKDSRIHSDIYGSDHCPVSLELD